MQEYDDGNGNIPATFNGYTGQNNIFPGRSFPVLIKMDANGNLIWGTHASTHVGAIYENLVIHGDYISLAGSHIDITWGSFSFPPIYNRGYDIYLARFDRQTGAILGMDTLPSNWGYSEYLTAMAADRRGNVYIGGEFQGTMYVGGDTLVNVHSGGIGTDYFLAKAGTANCNCALPEAGYSHTGANGTVQFTYTGAPGYDRLEWEFGDGTVQTTTAGTTSHTYAATGEHWVCVTAYDDSCGHDTWCTWVDPHRLSTEDLPKESFRCYPNPVGNELHVEASEPLAYTLYDLTGRAVASGRLRQGDNTVDTSALPQGLYMLRLANAQGAHRTVKVVRK